MSIALAYGGRLDTGNVKEGALERLAYGYPSHSFVIDRREAERLFVQVEAPHEEEAALALLYEDQISRTGAGSVRIFRYHEE